MRSAEATGGAEAPPKLCVRCFLLLCRACWISYAARFVRYWPPETSQEESKEQTDFFERCHRSLPHHVATSIPATCRGLVVSLVTARATKAVLLQKNQLTTSPQYCSFCIGVVTCCFYLMCAAFYFYCARDKAFAVPALIKCLESMGCLFYANVRNKKHARSLPDAPIFVTRCLGFGNKSGGYPGRNCYRHQRL